MNESLVSLAELRDEELSEIVRRAVGGLGHVRKCLIIHPDGTRNDFTHRVVPALYRALCEKGLEQLDTLCATGTHGPMSAAALAEKLGIDRQTCRQLRAMGNHDFNDRGQLAQVGEIPAEFVAHETGARRCERVPIMVNRQLAAGYDLVVAVNGTLPHEATGFSGGTKILFPGLSGLELIRLLHWGAALIGIPDVIGRADNPARRIVDRAAAAVLKWIESTPVISLNMVWTEDDAERVAPRGLFAGAGIEGFREALHAAAALSARLHVVYLSEALHVVVQRMPARYADLWTAGKGSYKLQSPGVIAEGGELILYAPHVGRFHTDPLLGRAIETLGYHGRDYVDQYCRRNPDFDLSVAAHSINLRGVGEMDDDGRETFPFRVTLASQIPAETCRRVGLGYRHPATIRREDFQGPGRLWIEAGGQYLYCRRAFDGGGAAC